MKKKKYATKHKQKALGGHREPVSINSNSNIEFDSAKVKMSKFVLNSEVFSLFSLHLAIAIPSGNSECFCDYESAAKQKKIKKRKVEYLPKRIWNCFMEFFFFSSSLCIFFSFYHSLKILSSLVHIKFVCTHKNECLRFDKIQYRSHQWQHENETFGEMFRKDTWAKQLKCMKCKK